MIFNMAASSSEDSSDISTKNSRAVLGDLFSELQLDFCTSDFANYMKVDVSSQVVHLLFNLKAWGSSVVSFDKTATLELI